MVRHSLYLWALLQKQYLEHLILRILMGFFVEKKNTLRAAFLVMMTIPVMMTASALERHCSPCMPYVLYCLLYTVLVWYMSAFVVFLCLAGNFACNSQICLQKDLTLYAFKSVLLFYTVNIRVHIISERSIHG